MEPDDYRERYQRANRWGDTAFIERPYIGSPGAPAQDETNASNSWTHLNAGMLVADEYTRWWKESLALRNDVALGDWSWLNKARITGPDAFEFLQYATVVDLTGQDVGHARFTPMVNERGNVAIEGITFRLADDEFIFTQSGAVQWLSHIRNETDYDVDLEDVTPDHTVFALQGPKSLDVLEAVVDEDFADLGFSRFRTTEVLGEEAIVARQGVTGELGYEFFFPVQSGKAHELWREVRETGSEYGLRELGFRAQLIGHTEINLATAIRDYLPARMEPEQIERFAKHWMSHEEAEAFDWGDEHFCTPAELGWGGLVALDASDFHGRDALREEADAGGPDSTFVNLRWESDDVLGVFGEQFGDGDVAPPMQLPSGQFRISYLPVEQDDRQVGWASGVTYSPNFRAMLSNARIDASAAMEGESVTVRWGGFTPDDPTREIAATVHPDALYDSKERDPPRP
ncbi:aminomethyltransferase family protein [Halobellus captivus]|uniref:aminomethyltransferase family protein n=1 Tax=Halobellus captivus TaxID=2592614 RepID=UPI0011A7EAEE|nr:aminomethyltransferase family protein [Halobellus captivus]